MNDDYREPELVSTADDYVTSYRDVSGQNYSNNVISDHVAQGNRWGNPIGSTSYDTGSWGVGGDTSIMGDGKSTETGGVDYSMPNSAPSGWDENTWTDWANDNNVSSWVTEMVTGSDPTSKICVDGLDPGLSWWDRDKLKIGPGILPPILADLVHDPEHALFSVNVRMPDIQPAMPADAPRYSFLRHPTH